MVSCRSCHGRSSVRSMHCCSMKNWCLVTVVKNPSRTVPHLRLSPKSFLSMMEGLIPSFGGPHYVLSMMEGLTPSHELNCDLSQHIHPRLCNSALYRHLAG